MTLHDPLTTIYRTLIHLGCEQAKDQTNPINVIAKIWQKFISRSIVRVEDQTLSKLKYYGSWGTQNLETSLLLRDGDGQCLAWARFFKDTLMVQGINLSTIMEIKPKESDGFIIKNWRFNSPGYLNDPDYDYPYLNIYSQGFINFTQNKYIWKCAQVEDMAGIPGQGQDNPMSWFNKHFLVQIGTVYYDQSLWSYI